MQSDFIRSLSQKLRVDSLDFASRISFSDRHKKITKNGWLLLVVSSQSF